MGSWLKTRRERANPGPSKRVQRSLKLTSHLKSSDKPYHLWGFSCPNLPWRLERGFQNQQYWLIWGHRNSEVWETVTENSGHWAKSIRCVDSFNSADKSLYKWENCRAERGELRKGLDPKFWGSFLVSSVCSHLTSLMGDLLLSLSCCPWQWLPLRAQTSPRSACPIPSYILWVCLLRKGYLLASFSKNQPLITFHSP